MQHTPLADAPYTCHVERDRITIAWHGRRVMTLKGIEAERVREKIERLDPHSAQLAMARITGNFKRGNERRAGRARGR